MVPFASGEACFVNVRSAEPHVEGETSRKSTTTSRPEDSLILASVPSGLPLAACIPDNASRQKSQVYFEIRCHMAISTMLGEFAFCTMPAVPCLPIPLLPVTCHWHPAAERFPTQRRRSRVAVAARYQGHPYAPAADDNSSVRCSCWVRRPMKWNLNHWLRVVP